MYETSYLVNRFVFTPDPKETTSPGPGGVAWDLEKADIKGATIICLAPGSKVALSFAPELRHGRKKADAKVIGAASDYSVGFVRETGEYEEVISTNEETSKILARVPGRCKIVLVDFGGRGGIARKWAAAMSETHENFLLMNCGYEISEESSSDVLASMQADAVRHSRVRVRANQCELKLGIVKLNAKQNKPIWDATGGIKDSPPL